MRFTHFLALAAVSSAATSSASAQEPRASTEARIRSIAPGVYRYDSDQDGHRAALGIGTTATGTLRDTLGLMITSITKGSPAEKAGLEEGNRIAAINGVSLRVNAADVEDGEMSNALTRRLTRELGKSKPGDEVELKVYRDGRTQTIKVKTADSDELFKRVDYVRQTRSEMENRPALGFSIGSTGSRRDTLGVLVMSVSDSSPASKAGIEEGNRIAAINGVSLRVSRDDAGDRWLGNTKAQRLQREISQLKPGDNVTLKVYSNGQFRDVTLKVARAGDLPKGNGGMMYLTGDGFSGLMRSTDAPDGHARHARHARHAGDASHRANAADERVSLRDAGVAPLHGRRPRTARGTWRRRSSGSRRACRCSSTGFVPCSSRSARACRCSSTTFVRSSTVCAWSCPGRGSEMVNVIV